MFSEENFPEARCTGVKTEGKDDSRNKVSEKTIEKLNRMVLGRDKNINEEYIKSFYLDVAEEYDDMITSAGSDRSFYVAKIISEFFPPNKDFSDFKVLDLAAGTGVLGPHLRKLGFQHLTAVDFSDPMLEELRKKLVYEKVVNTKLGESTGSIPEINDATYDIVIIAGGFAHGHMNTQVLRQAARALKKGGLFINAMSELYCSIVPELKDLDNLIHTMESEKIWKCILRYVQESKWPGLFQVCRKL